MANTKISALTAGTAIVGTEVIPGVQGGSTVKFTFTQIKTFTSASPTLVTPVLGVASGTSLALGGATIGANALAVTGTALLSGNVTLGASPTLATTSGPLKITASGVTSAWLGDTGSLRAWKVRADVGGYAWASSGNIDDAVDTAITRVSAGVIGVGTGGAGGVNGGIQAATGLFGVGAAATPSVQVGIAGTGLYSVSTTGFGVSVNGALKLDYGITNTGQITALSVFVANAGLSVLNGGISLPGDRTITWSGRGQINSPADKQIRLLDTGNANYQTLTLGATGAETTLTFGGEIITSASTATRAGFNLPSGIAPTAPADGDMWYDGTNLKVRLNGTTKTVTAV